MGGTAYETILAADRLLSGAQVRLYERKGSLVTLFCHSLYVDEEEARRPGLNGQERMTVGRFGRAIEHFLRHGYQIARIDEVARGLPEGRKSLLVSFDDGYFNNHRAEPVLKEFGGTAAVFLSTGHVKEGRAFWWDALYRARWEQGRGEREIHEECAKLNRRRTTEIEAEVRAAAPGADFKPKGDLERPFRPEEVRELAASGRFFFENHTAHHAVLTAYTDEEALGEIHEAQEDIERWTGRRPVAIAYPNGQTDARIGGLARRAGLRVGFSSRVRKDYDGTMQDEAARMMLGRFSPQGTGDIEAQCRYFRSDLMITERVRRMRGRG